MSRLSLILSRERAFGSYRPKAFDVSVPRRATVTSPLKGTGRFCQSGRSVRIELTDVGEGSRGVASLLDIWNERKDDMRIIEHASEMQQQADKWRREGKRIAFVPTMGYLHAGHLTLMQAARQYGDLVIMSIFVNPAQFGPNEDFARYPRDIERDVRLASEVGVEAAFIPRVEEIYPSGFQTYVEVTDVTTPLCGRSRPGHFRGVTTVVAKLFNLVKPHTAVFGQKDYQQLVTINRMVTDLNMDTEIVGHPIVRETDGLAMSSRNSYLDASQRRTALRLSRSLEAAQHLVEEGEQRSDIILERVRETLEAGDGLRVDYAELCHPETLEKAPKVNGPTLLALAAYVGSTRLIDNRLLLPKTLS